jgi:predicted AAA+ superfamily ATPase
MAYPRNVRPVLEAALAESRVVALTGARQTGKTTLARRVAAERKGRYLSLDDAALRDAVERDPTAALEGPYPVVVDEFQFGGDRLLRAVKRAVDADETPGRFLLTGSSHFLSLPRLSESLAGRVALVDLYPLSQGEIRSRREGFAERLFGPTDALRRSRPEELRPLESFEAVCRGGYPEPLRLSVARRRAWFSDYLRTIVVRDVRALTGSRRAGDLPRLLRLLAARTANEVNLAEVSRDVGMPRSSLDDYVALVEMVGLWIRLPAWSRNLTSKVVRHPKGHLVDSGLASSLLGVDPRSLTNVTSAARGPLLETFVATELLKQRSWSSVPFDLHHFRDRSLFEVDLVLETADGRVAAVEVKASSTVEARDFRGLDGFASRLGDSFANGVLLYLGADVVPMGHRRTALPLSALWAA